MVKFWRNHKNVCLVKFEPAFGKDGTYQKLRFNLNFKSVFGSVVVVAFQITFRAEIHANDFFKKKKLFLTSAHQNDLKSTNRTQF